MLSSEFWHIYLSTSGYENSFLEYPVGIVYRPPKGMGILFRWYRWCWNIDYKWFPVDKSF